MSEGDRDRRKSRSPIAGGLRDIRDPRVLAGDVLAGTVVAVMLVPQAMAYAMLAGLPPQVGLYASVAPPAVYALLGSSRTLAVGPVAIVSLLVAAGTAVVAAPGSPEVVGAALILALLSGAMLLAMGLLRLGALVNLLSHPVIAGFTSAAAILIGLSQVKHLLGLAIARTHSPAETLSALWAARGDARPAAMVVGLLAVVGLGLAAGPLRDWLQRLGLGESRAALLARTAPLVAVVAGTLAVRFLALESAGVAIVGEIPRGLPPLAMPQLDVGRIVALLPSAGAIAIVGFLESIAVAKGLAARRRERIDANRELIGLGAANLAAAVTGGYPVTGGFSRSAVNADAGARSGLSSLVTAGLVALTLVALTPLLHDLPKAVLAAIVLVAVAKLIDLKSMLATWRYSRMDGAAMMVTFGATLLIGVELGVLAGVVTALLMHTARTSVPHVAVVGRVPGTEHYRNERRHTVETLPHVLAVRIDESLYFANAAYLETWLLNAVADRPDVRELLLICSAINVIDASAAETLEHIADELNATGIRFHLAEVKGPVMDRLQRGELLQHLGGTIYLSTHEAMSALAVTPAEDEGLDSAPSSSQGSRHMPSQPRSSIA